MGYDASCRIRFEGRTFPGRAFLETRELVIRGPSRLSVPLSEVTKAEVVGGWLRLGFGQQTLDLELGDKALRWSQRITNPPSRLDKLGVKPGMRVVLLGPIGDAGFTTELRARGATVTRGLSTARAADIVFLSAASREDLNRVPSAAGAIKPDGSVWIVRPKGQRAVTEADSMSAGKRAGLVDVKVVSFSEALTAEKYVIPVAKRAAPRPSRSPSPRTTARSPSRART